MIMIYKNWKVFIYISNDKAVAFNAINHVSKRGSILEVLKGLN